MKKLLLKIKALLCREDKVKKYIQRGMHIGKNVSIVTDYIDAGHCFLISIGDNVTIAVNSVILAHDASTKSKLGYSKVGRVEIGSDVFIGANAIVLPGVKIGNKCIIGAGGG